MKPAVSRRLMCVALLGVFAQVAPAVEPALPQRDLTVELRQVVEGRDEGSSGATHYSAGGDESGAWEPQMVQVRNGEKALLHLNDAIPMQWTQSVSTQNVASNGTAGAAGSNSGSITNSPASVSNTLVWFDAGQSISVQPKWPGGNKPAVLLLEVQRAAVDARTGGILPTQSRKTVSTTLTVPLAEWLTVAATGKALKPGVYSSEAAVAGRRLLQVRVMVP